MAEAYYRKRDAGNSSQRVIAGITMRAYRGTVLPEIDCNSSPATRPRVYARTGKLELVASILGANTNDARARLFGVTARTIYSVLKGRPVSDEMIAKTLSVMETHAAQLAEAGIDPAFDGVFEVDWRAA